MDASLWISQLKYYYSKTTPRNNYQGIEYDINMKDRYLPVVNFQALELIRT